MIKLIAIVCITFLFAGCASKINNKHDGMEKSPCACVDTVSTHNVI